MKRKLVFSHLSKEYKEFRDSLGVNSKYNGAYYYSREIVKNIIPNVKTDRPWVTAYVEGMCYDNAIVFIHKNTSPWLYGWLNNYKNLILVCSNEYVMESLKFLGKVVYLPLSVDVNYVKKFRRNEGKDCDCCFVGNMWKFKTEYVRQLGKDVDIISGIPRNRALERIAHYKKAYAIGRCAIEAKILGCEILPIDPRYPDPSVWEVLDNKDAAKILQDEIDKIDLCRGGENRQIIIDTTNPTFIYKNQNLKSGRFNGAYYYSQEIVNNIIPNVKTARPWDTLTMKSIGTVNGAICFLHQCINMDEAYAWLKRYKDLILVVSSPYVYDWAIKNGYKAIYLPLSIDVEYVKQFKKKKRVKNACFCGNIWKFREQEIAETIPDDVDFQPPNICREDLLRFMADYKYVYAVGRCALEAQVLGAKILQCYKKFPVEHWKVIDNKDAAKMLQEKLDEIDGN